jgi:hypothetical protein
MGDVIKSLELMGKGMFTIFIVIIAIYLVIIALLKFNKAEE